VKWLEQAAEKAVKKISQIHPSISSWLRSSIRMAEVGGKVLVEWIVAASKV
jgi:hypothetical protein